ncbi:MAG: hypothetical protein IJ731_01100 [Eubacterium sp.]|nr:hypothetical protein [Eubacterium sp.]
MKLCKKEYKKPPTFPKWAGVNPELADKKIYYLYKNGIKADFGDLKNHSNHIEMAGFRASSIISYRVNNSGDFDIYRFVVFPSIRVNPNNTHGSLCEHFEGVSLRFNGENERIKSIEFNGILTFNSVAGGVKITRKILPFRDKCALLEEIEITFESDGKLEIENAFSKRIVEPEYTPYDYDIELKKETYFIDKKSQFSKNEKAHIRIIYSAENVSFDDAENEVNKRLAFISENAGRLKITTPSSNINLECEFAKLRASESIFKTKNGLMHAPGGGNYYAALWTNDQCEYANPFFAYLGYDKANEQSLNCYDLFSKLVYDDRAVLTSICAEGEDFWNGAGDRGDTSMFVYGFTRYLLTTGDRKNAEKYLDKLETACRYIESKINESKVVQSDSDELENRFESGSANLSTAVITYDAFLSMMYLEKEFGNTEKSEKYRQLSNLIKQGIEEYFEANVEGFETYRYCEEESKLRSWICLPLTVGINRRKEGTIAALKSEKLKKPCGLLTRSGEQTYWDRSLLYALRGMFNCGSAGDALEMLEEYTFSRLFCSHVPYPIEAFPEGNGAQLSAEAALYVRIITEGILGFRPTGFNSFEIHPNLPEKWDFLKIENFVFAGEKINFDVIREQDGRVVVRQS